LLDSADDGGGPGEGRRHAQPPGKRYLVKMSLSPNGTEMNRHTLVSALRVDSDGMFVESQHPIAVGKNVYWSFMGISELRGVTIPGTVLQEEPRPEWAEQNRYYLVKFDEEARSALQRLEDLAGEAPPKDSC
jgi:hypothetical protein